MLSCIYREKYTVFLRHSVSVLNCLTLLNAKITLHFWNIPTFIVWWIGFAKIFLKILHIRTRKRWLAVSFSWDVLQVWVMVKVFPLPPYPDRHCVELVFPFSNGLYISSVKLSEPGVVLVARI